VSGYHQPMTEVALNLSQAAVALGVSLNTVKRKIKDGELRAEKVARPQGHSWVVWVPQLDPPNQPPVDQALALRDALAPLATELQSLREARSLDRALLVEQAETIGAQRAEIEALRARVAAPRRRWLGLF
jgi:excisionase family DNA binding protein